MKKTILSSILMLLICATSAQTKFDSTDNKNLIAYEVPEWYQDAKIGYWAIWGLYSIPAYGTEWYGRNIYFQKRFMDYHKEKFGDPAEFQYDKLTTLFKAEKFNADEWLDLTVAGGGKFFTMIGIFHDNYCMWDSKTNPYNTVNTGPHRDIVAELKRSTQEHGIKFGLSNHSAWNGTFFEQRHKRGYDKNDTPEDRFKYGTGEVDQAAIERWWAQTLEMADKYQPDLYYFDWCWNKSKLFDQRRRDFISYYYNEALKWNNAEYPNPDVVVNYKGVSRLPTGSAVLDLERGGMSEIKDEVWQNDTSIGKKSWSYVPDEDFKSPNHIIDMLMDIISKNGVLMLAFGPNGDGSIPVIAKESLTAVGDWLKINGEAVYATRPWSSFGEGVTVPKVGHQGGDEVDYVAEDVRFTRSKDNTTLYVTFLGYPEGGEGLVKSLNSQKIDLSTLEKVELLGSSAKIKTNQTSDGLHIKLPKSAKKDCYAYAFKLRFKDVIPTLKK